VGCLDHPYRDKKVVGSVFVLRFSCAASFVYIYSLFRLALADREEGCHEEDDPGMMMDNKWTSLRSLLQLVLFTHLVPLGDI
jgi:hypothetical protein